MEDPLEAARERGKLALQQLKESGKLVPYNETSEGPVIEIGGDEFCLPYSITSTPGFREIMQILIGSGHDDPTCIFFFLNPSELLQGTPTEALRRGDDALVMRYAESYLEQSAA